MTCVVTESRMASTVTESGQADSSVGSARPAKERGVTQ